MAEEKKKNSIFDNDQYKKLLDSDLVKIPQVGDIVKCKVISASKSEVRLDIGGVLIGVVRGRELYREADEYANLKSGDEVEATVVEEDNENGEMELSFRHAGQQKAWSNLTEAAEQRKIIKVKVVDANKGGLLVGYGQISGFLPVSQLAPENYPRVDGGDKSKILEKLKSFIGSEFEVKVMALEKEEERLIVSEKEAWQEKQKDTIAKYKIGSQVEGRITAITDFGVFISFGENLEGLIHISELAWQRIDDPTDLYKIGDKIKAEIISVDSSKIFLSAKKLIKDPWQEVDKKYKVGQAIKGAILKINPFGLFIELDQDIHGLAHISQLDLGPGEKINQAFKVGDKKDFTIISIEPKDHRLGLVPARKKRPQRSEPAAAEQPQHQDKTKAEAPVKKPAADKAAEAKQVIAKQAKGRPATIKPAQPAKTKTKQAASVKTAKPKQDKA